MAEKTAVLESLLSCHVCSETFRDPVSLSCNHSFCSSCLKEFWEQTGNKNCPICKRRSSRDDPSIDFSFKELKLFPYFTVYSAGDAKTSEIKICETKISV
uniref:RING-type domain-containing protein n=1 Tax=Poecilia reticulata TaxID=8081 RepID=A0A3P9N8U3_POERE